MSERTWPTGLMFRGPSVFPVRGSGVGDGFPAGPGL